MTDKMKKSQNSLPMLYVLFSAAFIAAFNENIINVALGDIMSAFSIGANTANWLVTGYMIVTAVVVTVIAFLLRRFNLRTVFFGGAALFITGSVLAVFAPTFPLLLACRLLQAAGTGVFIPTMMNTTLALAPRKQLGTYLAIGGCCITFGPAFGPVVSGLMVTFFGWRGIFVVPAAAMVVIALFGAVLIRNIGERVETKLDIFSVVLSAVGLTALVYGLAELTSNTLVAGIALVCGILILGAFVVRQAKVSNPLLNLAPMHEPRFACACVLVVVAMMTTFSMSVLLPLYFTGSAGTSAFIAGVLILIPILINAGTAVLGGRIFDKLGEWPLLPAGFALVAVGQVAVFLVAGSINLVWVVLASCLVYAGVGFVFSPSQSAGLKTLPHDQNPFGVGIMSTFIQISAAIGPSLFVGVLSSVMDGRVASGSSQAAATAAGFSSAVMVAAAIAVAGTVIAFIYARSIASKASSEAKVKIDASQAPALGQGKEAPQAPAQEQLAPAAAELLLASVMKTNVYAIAADAPVYEAVETMLERQTSGLPVCGKDGMVLGFVSDGDIMKSIADVREITANLYLSLSQLANETTLDERLDAVMRMPVMDLATTDVIFAEAGDSLECVCSIFSQHHLKKLPVVDCGRLVGSISRTDVNRALFNRFVQSGKAAR